MPVSLMQPLPLYLGPNWHPRNVPERILVRFLESCGGTVDAAGLSPLFQHHVWLKPAIGNLTAFCDNLSCKYRVVDDCDREGCPGILWENVSSCFLMLKCFHPCPIPLVS